MDTNRTELEQKSVETIITGVKGLVKAICYNLKDGKLSEKDEEAIEKTMNEVAHKTKDTIKNMVHEETKKTLGKSIKIDSKNLVL